MLGRLIAALLSLNFIIISAFAVDANQTLAGGQYAYYGNGLELQNNPNLKDDLHKILNSPHVFRPKQPDMIGNCSSEKNCYRHRSMSYSEARLVVFSQLHIERDSQGTYVEDVYCMKKNYFKDPRQIANQHNIVNIEHTWPQSRFSNSFGKEVQKTDLHHLFPTDSKANNIRANHSFGEAPSHVPRRDLCDESTLHSRGSSFVFNPPVEHHGNVARAIFYFSVKYKLPIDNEEEKILRRWHAEDPVDDEERARHAKIVELQRTRNPFIDHPDLVAEIRDF
jgi:deoxyribonuclease I